MPSGRRPSVTDPSPLRGSRKPDAGASDRLRQVLADACRILAAQGHDAFLLGHASARLAPGADRLWVKPSGIGLGDVRPADLVEVDLAGNRLAGDGPLPLELPIHLAIQRRRPDVVAVVHSHPFHVAALAATDEPFRLVSQESLAAAAPPGRYDSPLLIDTPAAADALADALGDGSAVILRNHGLVVADASVEGAVLLALALERSAALQLAAAAAGTVREISADEAADLRRQLGTSHTERARRLFASLRSTLDDAGPERTDAEGPGG